MTEIMITRIGREGKKETAVKMFSEYPTIAHYFLCGYIDKMGKVGDEIMIKTNKEIHFISLRANEMLVDDKLQPDIKDTLFM